MSYIYVYANSEIGFTTYSCICSVQCVYVRMYDIICMYIDIIIIAKQNVVEGCSLFQDEPPKV